MVAQEVKRHSPVIAAAHLQLRWVLQNMILRFFYSQYNKADGSLTSPDLVHLEIMQSFSNAFSPAVLYVQNVIG